MKKFYKLFIFSFLFCLLGLSGSKYIKAQATSNTQTEITSSVEITEDTTYSYVDFSFYKENMSDTCFTVKSGATLTLNDCSVGNLSDNVSINHIFVVESDAKLVLNNVDLSLANYNSAGIYNLGTVEINNVSFKTGGYSIDNLSEKVNPILLKQGSLERVYLQKGYISLDKDSIVTGTTNIICSKNPSNGTLLVKGVGSNVFANRYLSNFTAKYGSTSLYLDYIGDHTGELLDATGKIALNSGDVIVAHNIADEIITGDSWGGNISYPSTDVSCEECSDLGTCTAYMCTTNRLLVENYSYRNFNNYEAFQTKKTCRYLATEQIVTVNICIVKDGNSSSSFNKEFLAGNNHAVFIDIPEGYEYKSTEFYIGSTKDETNFALLDSDSDGKADMFSNGKYMRPVITYLSTSYTSQNIKVNVNFEKVETYANVTVDAKAGISVNYDDQLTVGDEEYEFTISAIEDIEIKEVYFNEQKVNLETTATGYVFWSKVEENNTIRVVSAKIITVVPQLSKTTFIYSENIELVQEYEIDDNETINITYVVDPDKSVGEYDITTATCDNEDYVIRVASGKYTYKIDPQEIDLSAVVEIVDNVSIDYAKDLKQNLTLDMFVSSMSDLITANLVLDGVVIDSLEETINIQFQLKDEDNYIFKDDISSLDVDLTINPKTLVVQPQPTQTEFEYGDTIVLTQNYTVPVIGDTIVITYTANSSSALGKYPITEGSCNSVFYIISVDTGNYEYSIVQKNIVLAEVVTLKENVRVDYSKNLKDTLNKEMFISSMPEEYLSANLNLNDLDIDSTTESIIIQFTLKNGNYIFKENVSTLTATLNINPIEIDVSGFKFEPIKTEYCKSKVEAVVIGYDPDLVSVTYSYYKVKDNNQKELVDFAEDSGKYEVHAICSSKHDLYTVEYENTTTIEITKVTVDLTDYLKSVESFTFTYDGTKQYIDAKVTTVPNGAIVVSVTNNGGHTNVGDYNITINFSYDPINYICISEFTSVLHIKPKPVNIALEQKSFYYTGNLPVLKAVISSGLITGDDCTVELDAAVNVNAGTHYVAVKSLSNSNYTFSQGLELEYKIKKIDVDLSLVTFSPITATYDGFEHRPVLNGTLPQGILYTIDDVPCKDAGVYDVKCSFVSNNDNVNYNTPDPIYTKVTINKKPIQVIFTAPSNMIANGLEKKIEISFSGLVGSDTVVVEENYSDRPINAGEYTLTVDVPSKSNYYIDNNRTFTFTIFTNSLSLRQDGVTVQFEGKFANNNAVNVSKVDNNNVEKVLEDENIKEYTTLNFTYTNFSTEPVKVSVKTDGLLDSTKYLKLYKVSGQELQEIEFTLEGDVISFMLSANSEIVFVEENTKVYTFRIQIITICSLAVACLILIVVFAIISSRQSNPYLFINKNKKQK